MNNRNSKIFSNLAKEIKSLREEKRLSLKDLSKKSGININYLKVIEQGNATGITITKIIRLAESFDIKPHSLLDKIK